jgi:hypothetical protein
MIDLPPPRGETTEALFRALTAPPGPVASLDVPESSDPLADEDLQLALYCLYELHYRGLPGVDDEWEWSPQLLELRRRLEQQYLGALDQIVEPARAGGAPDWREMDLELRAIAASDDAPSLSQHLQRDGTLDQLREFLIHRSAYQLKEADPHSWALPRLSGRPKAALVEIQADEYGGGRPERIHARLFADAMDAFGLDSRYGAYVERLPAVTLATVNLMSLFGLHRRWRGAIVGHLALFEMTSSVPNRRYGDAARRLGPEDQRATEFFDEHVEADAVHESVAAVDLAGGLARDEPAVAADILFGARALVAVEGRWAATLAEAWDRQDTALLAVGETVEASA